MRPPHTIANDEPATELRSKVAEVRPIRDSRGREVPRAVLTKLERWGIAIGKRGVWHMRSVQGC